MGEAFNISIPLPSWVVGAIAALEDSGFQAWCVGGCVRDSLLGRTVHDFDLATSATWEQTKHVFEGRGCTVHETGTKHGTVTVVVEGNAIEITTFRSEGNYSDGRHPDSVDFVNTIEEDLERRDFTINAMAFHPLRGLCDPYEGRVDLEKRIIRCVGDPATRFKEDALRILRACRFASQLGFAIEPDTLRAMTSYKMTLARIAAERVTHELEEMLCGEHIHDALMATIDVLGAVLPEICAMKGFEQHTPYHIYDVLEHTAYVLQYTSPYPLVRWAALLHDTGKPGAFFMDGKRGHFYGHPKLSVMLARSVMSRMCYSQAFAKDVIELVRIHDELIQPAPKPVKRALLRMDGRVDLFRALCNLKRADAMAQAPRCAPRVELADDLVQTLEDILAANDAFSLKNLAIGGNDVVALGMQPGPEVGALLHRALDAVIDEEIPNERDALLAFLEAQR